MSNNDTTAESVTVTIENNENNENGVPQITFSPTSLSDVEAKAWVTFTVTNKLTSGTLTVTHPLLQNGNNIQFQVPSGEKWTLKSSSTSSSATLIGENGSDSATITIGEGGVLPPKPTTANAFKIQNSSGADRQVSMATTVNNTATLGVQATSAGGTETLNFSFPGVPDPTFVITTMKSNPPRNS